MPREEPHALASEDAAGGCRSGIVFSVLLVIIFWGFRSAVPADPLNPARG